MIRNNKIWQKTKLGNIGKIVSGGTPSTDKLKYWNGDIFWITPTEITKLQGKYILNTERKITKLGLEKSSAKLIPAMSLIICSRATVGDCGINKIEITTNQGFKNIIPNKKIDILFLYYFICTKKLQLKKISSGSTFLEFSKFDLEKFNILLPPLPEQNRIVAVLEVWDGVIEKLVKKIEIKRQIKKGLMQDLLTGKKRLSGFRGEWESVKLGDVSNIKRGNMITRNDITDGSVPVVAGGQQPAYYHNKSNRTGKTITVSGSGAYAGYVDFYNCPIFVSDGMSIQEKNLDIDFVYYFLKLKQEYIYSLQTGGAQPHVYPKDLHRLKLNIPKSKEEQTAIAQILTTADREIESLEKKKRIIEEQKKFLLNNLVTGRIRV